MRDQLLVMFGIGWGGGFLMGAGLMWWWPFGPREPEPEDVDEEFLADYVDPYYGDDVVEGEIIDPPGLAMVPGEMPWTQAAPSLADRPAAASQTGNHGETAGPGGPSWEGPEPGQDLYRWSHREPIRQPQLSSTVIDWDSLPWAEQQALLGWDWSQRMHAWVEDWERAELAA